MYITKGYKRVFSELMSYVNYLVDTALRNNQKIAI